MTILTPIPGVKALLQIKRARANGIVNPLYAWQESKRAGLPYELGLAFLSQESGGGHNVFGHDPTICVGWGEVTKAKYLSYKSKRGTFGRGGMQGVGPMQLTWYSYQDAADKLGGCWIVNYNMRIGFSTAAYNIKRYGLHAGIAAYNGSGAAAQAYANSVLAFEASWKKKIG